MGCQHSIRRGGYRSLKNEILANILPAIAGDVSIVSVGAVVAGERTVGLISKDVQITVGENVSVLGVYGGSQQGNGGESERFHGDGSVFDLVDLWDKEK